MTKSVQLQVLILSCFFNFAKAEELSIEKIMSKTEQARQIPNASAKVELKTKDAVGGEDQKSFKYSRKRSSDGRFQTVTRFFSPATIKNQGILFLEHEGYQNDVFLYLPTYKKIRRVESHSQNSAFMGSAFTYSDIATPSLNDYKNKLVKKATCPVGSGTCFMVESIPKTDEVKVRIGAEKSIQWIEASRFITVQWEFYDKSEKLVKKMQASQYISGSQPNTFFAKQLEIENFVSKKSTRLDFSEIDLKTSLDDSLFTQQALSRER